ncbi:hypothetical protein Dimus_004267 [Dionaea muscipula]
MLKEAEKLMELMEGNGIEPDQYSYNQFLKGLCKANRLDKAYLLLDVMGAREGIVIKKLCNGQNARRAFKLFEEMGLKGIAPDVVTFTILVEALFKEGNSNIAMKLLDQIDDRDGFVPRSCTVHHTDRSSLQDCED